MKESFLKELSDLCRRNQVDTVVVSVLKSQVEELDIDVRLNNIGKQGIKIPSVDEFPKQLRAWQYGGVIINLFIKDYDFVK